MIVSAVVTVGLQGAALGQTASPNAGNAPNSPIGISPLPNQNTPGEDLRSTSTAPAQPFVSTGLFPSLGNGLLGDGIDFHGTLLDHATTNPSAGNTPGNTSQLALFRPEVDVDLGKLAGIPGAIIHASLTYWFSKSDEPGDIVQTGGVLDGYQPRRSSRGAR